jgi:hypothetical protein
MNLDSGRSGRPAIRRPEPSRKSILLLFTIGSLMLVVPLVTVLASAQLCRSDASECFRSEAVRLTFSGLPYVMIGGGILIGYNMKRISDSITYDARLDDEEESTGSHQR